ncbi:hypothetical protein WJX82_010411 [Trebouxia sp. C0006]
MSCLVARHQSLGAKDQPFRQRHVGLRACRRSSNSSTNNLNFSQLQKVHGGVHCDATAAQAQKTREWDFEMNDKTPANVTVRSHQVVWWKNDVRGRWQQRIDHRTDPRGMALKKKSWI